MFRATFALGAVLMAGIAQADTGPPLPADWQGVFSTETVGGCVIKKSGSAIRETRYGIGRIGGAYEFGILDDAGSDDVYLSLENNLSYRAGQDGYNGIVGIRYEVSHTADAVFESGQNWRDGDGKPFDYSGTFIVLVYGTPVRLECS